MPDRRLDFDELARAMKASAGRPMTAEQIRQQKVSFILGTLGSDSSMTRKQVEDRLAKYEGELSDR